MSLLVSVKRGSQELHLGAYAAVLLTYDQLLHAADNSVLATHRNNRWYAGGEEYHTLEVVGPLVVSQPDGKSLGPYMNASMFDGVAYVDRRVFAFTDVQREDWYVHDAGAHWRELKIAFQRTGP